ncbi:unnamed protein product [Rotaria socialis]|uniref:Autophagy-related protein 27 n=3 Tax=Rotaria socialis TaxID=392032 RepID=A0A818IKB7_9BILA|nr:unnamed protein product [Rotaria socialis]CAF4323603.1 unnamed protein product [Rotaria socialis]
MYWLTIATSFAILSLLIIADDSCRYQTDKGVIDISSLARTDDKAKYPDKVPATGSGYKYSYNPCKPFTELPSCQGVAACQVSTDGKYSFSIGKQETAKWNPGGIGGYPTVTYTDGPKTLIVTLVCSKNGSDELEALGESSTNNYKMRLTNKCACWDGCGGGPQTTTKSSGGKGGKGGITGGAVFIILLVVLFVVYFIGFAAYYRFRLERTGVELIAHRTFWVGLPSYAKDGAVHIYRRVLNKGDTPYQSV